MSILEESAVLTTMREKFPIGTFVANEFIFCGEHAVSLGVVKEIDSCGSQIQIKSFANLTCLDDFQTNSILGYSYNKAGCKVRLATNEEIEKLCNAMRDNGFNLQEHIRKYVAEKNESEFFDALREIRIKTCVNDKFVELDFSTLSKQDLRKMIVN